MERQSTQALLGSDFSGKGGVLCVLIKEARISFDRNSSRFGRVRGKKVGGLQLQWLVSKFANQRSLRKKGIHGDCGSGKGREYTATKKQRERECGQARAEPFHCAKGGEGREKGVLLGRSGKEKDPREKRW